GVRPGLAALGEFGLRAALNGEAAVRLLPRAMSGASDARGAADVVVTARMRSLHDSTQLIVRVVDALSLELVVGDSASAPPGQIAEASVLLGQRVAQPIMQRRRADAVPPTAALLGLPPPRYHDGDVVRPAALQRQREERATHIFRSRVRRDLLADLGVAHVFRQTIAAEEQHGALPVDSETAHLGHGFV